MNIFWLINIVVFVIYGLDKFLAISEQSRISERMLHVLALIGGVIGATLAMIIFRHKIMKMPFVVVHLLIVVIWFFIWYFGE